MREPLEAELWKDDPVVRASTETVEGEEDHQQEDFQKMNGPLSIREQAIPTIMGSEEFQIYEDKEDDDDDSETEWGSCVEFEQGHGLPQHELLSNGGAMTPNSLEAKLGLAEGSSSNNKMNKKIPTTENTVLGSSYSSIEDDNTDSSPTATATSRKKSPISLRAPMNHDEIKHRKQELEEKHRQQLREEKPHKERSAIQLPEIEVQLKELERMAQENSDSSSCSSSDNEKQESISQIPLGKIHVNFAQEQAQNRLEQMKSRWESMQFSSNLGGSSDISFLNSNDKDSSSGSEGEQSLGSDDEKAQRPQRRQPRGGLPQKSNSRAKRTANRRGRSLLDNSSQSTAPDDRRAALLQNKRASGNRRKALMAFKDATRSVRANITGRENFHFRSIVRKSRVIDMETGYTRTREFTAQRVYDEEFFTAMNPKKRRKQLFLKKRMIKKIGNVASTDHPHHHEDELRKGRNSMSFRTQAQRSLFGDDAKEEQTTYQYRLSSMIAKDNDLFHASSFNLLREYLYWCFRNHFLMVLLTESILFLTWCWGFAIIYYILGRLNPQCIRGNRGYDFEEGEMSLVDAFTLSWTTFSTVGYGHIHPSVHGEGSSTRCVFITILASLQSFIGVLTASFCSAIIFAKIAKYQSIAHVMFSENVVIRFGEELMQGREESQPDLFNHIPDDRSAKSNRSSKSGVKSKKLDRGSTQGVVRYPCPIMEFRVVNLLHNERGGEIMNCKLNVVASTIRQVTKIDKKRGSGFFDTACPSKPKAQNTKTSEHAGSKGRISSLRSSIITTSGDLMKRGSIIQKVNRRLTSITSANNPYTLEGSNTDSEVEGKPFKEAGSDDNGDDESVELQSLKDDDVTSTSGREKDERKLTRRKSIFVDEEPCGAANSQRVFSKIEIETDSHPFFKRVWNIRHILNENSPLLSEETRNVIRRNGGLWPATLCNPDAIEGCLEISQLIVSLSGTAVVSGSSVYKLHVYERSLLEIGRTFENPLARDQDGKLTVDMQLVHTTKPQFAENPPEDDEELKRLNRGRRFSFRGISNNSLSRGI